MAQSTPPFSDRDLSEPAADQGRELTANTDKVLDGVGDLGTATSMQKTWHIAGLPDLELAELSIVFPDFASGMIDTAVLCEIVPEPFDPTQIPNLCQWYDPDVGVTSSTAGVTAWQDRFTFESFTSTPPLTPEEVLVNGLTMIRFDGSDRMAEIDPEPDSCLRFVGANDFTSVTVHRSTNTGRGWIWGTDSPTRWFTRIATNGSDFEFNVDDNAASVSLIANDVDFANNTIYIIIAMRTGDFLRLYYGNGGSLSEASNSPKFLGSGYGSVTPTTNTQMGDRPVADQGFLGELGDLLFYNKGLTATERSQLYNYLVNKWDL